MRWKLDKSKPICPQLSEQLCVQIATGVLAPHQKTYSVREVAVTAGVNPNTVQRAFEGLEQEGILYSIRGSGWYVAEDTSLAQQTLQRLIAQKTADFFENMNTLGLTLEQTKEYVKEWEQ